MKIIIQRDRRTKDPLYKNKKKIKNKNKKAKLSISQISEREIDNVFAIFYTK